MEDEENKTNFEDAQIQLKLGIQGASP